MERRVGLTIKRRSHFTNIYGPFCPECGQAIESRKALQTHLAMTHGKRLVHYKLRPGAVGPHYVSRPLNIEGQELNRGLLDEYLSDMKLIWRLSEVGHTDLIFVERIERKSPKDKALYSICLAIITRGLEEAIATAPARMRRVTEYVRQHSDLVGRIQQQQRYLRLKTPGAKAKLLSLGLANPTISLTYAERAKANSREFRKKDRIMHYVGPKAKDR